MSTQTNTMKRANWRALCVLPLLAISSCKKEGSVTANEGPPDSVILEACKRSAGNHWGGGYISEVVRGTPLVSEAMGTTPAGSVRYPIRVVYEELQEQPYTWDPVTKLPRPGDWKAAPKKGEYHFTQNEFGEWNDEHIRSGWLSPAPGPLINDYGQRPAIHEAYKKADIDQLEVLLAESKATDQKKGIAPSHETKLREFWLECANNIQKSWKRDEQERADRLREQQEAERFERQSLAEIEATAGQREVQDAIAAEEAEAARLYSMGWVGSGRDGRTIDEFMHLGEWKYPQQARAAMERAKAQDEANLRRHYANDPNRLSDVLSSFESAKTSRDQRMREEIEYQQKRALNPDRYPDAYKHFFYPGETDAWQRAQGGAESGVPRKPDPISEVNRMQGGSEAARNQSTESTAPPTTPDPGEGATKSFLTRFIESGEANTPNGSVACYADTVDYYDKGLRTRDQIRQDTTEHFGKWPKRSYRLVGEPRIVRESATREVITCDVAFEVSDG